jgi:DNA-directed RNA polymerase specialized sigma24 family protein
MTIARTLKRPPGLDEIRSVFALAFTDLAASDLLPYQVDTLEQPTETGDSPGALMAEPQLGAAELVAVEETVANVVDRLDPEDRRVLVRKMVGESDGEIATALGRSRPTVAKRKSAVLGALGDVLGDLSDREQAAVLDHLYLELLKDDT